jgi:phosphoenolpyruvate carboxykinase (GTP)
MRVLNWVIERIEGRAGGIEHVFGVSPRFEDLNWNGLDFAPADFARITSIDADAWRHEVESHGELFARLGTRLPAELAETRAALARSLGA